MTSKNLTKGALSSEQAQSKSHDIFAITISEAANSKYRENLLNDIDVTFERNENSVVRFKIFLNFSNLYYQVIVNRPGFFGSGKARAGFRYNFNKNFGLNSGPIQRLQINVLET